MILFLKEFRLIDKFNYENIFFIVKIILKIFKGYIFELSWI